ncbi:MAG TPA: hypothetical protein VIC57_07730 [Candidatus Dormibacteraeota bacterium]
MSRPDDVVSVAEFLRTGWLGPVGPGMTEAAVRERWGEPTVWRLTRPPSRCYGPVMLVLRDGVITHAGLDMRYAGLPGPPGFVFEPELWTLDGFRGAVERVGLHLEVAVDDAREPEPMTEVRIRESGVAAVFDESGGLRFIGGPE